MSDTFHLPLGAAAEWFVELLTTSLSGLFAVIRTIFQSLYEAVFLVLDAPPFWVIIIGVAVIAYLAKGWKLALGSLIGFLVIVGVGQWENAMTSLALVLVASVIAIALSIPLGIWAAKSDRASRGVKPVLDFMQTMPAFVYLIPALILFRVGVVPGIVATIIFAMAPGVRMTELGIRGVDSEVVEAGRAFGATPGRILRQIQLPLAMPSIMAGVNQVIMLALSMVVIAGMVGAGGLGAAVVQSLNRIDVALGFEAGISVVILAMFLDRVTAAFAGRERKLPAFLSFLAVKPGTKAAKVRNFGLAGVAAAAVVALVVTAIVGGGAGAKLENGDDKQVTIAVFNGWDESVAASELWKAILEEKGYDVTLEYADPAPAYSGVATGEYDVTLDTWLPITHADYVEEYGDTMVDLGAWNDESKLTIAVNEDAPITSLSELGDNADLFGGQLYGIEPGAGLTRVTQDAVIPGYGLEGLNFQTSSTAAMLTELKTATDAGENVVVTLWRPHWAYDAFPVRDLEDPEGLLGETESIHSYGKADIKETHPTFSGWLENFRMDSEQLYSLGNDMFNSGADASQYGEIVQQWISENQEYVDSLTA